MNNKSVDRSYDGLEARILFLMGVAFIVIVILVVFMFFSPGGPRKNKEDIVLSETPVAKEEPVVKKPVPVVKPKPEKEKVPEFIPEPEKEKIVDVVKSFCDSIGMESKGIKLIKCSSEGNVHRLHYSTVHKSFEVINEHFWNLKFQKELRGTVLYCSFYNKSGRFISYVFDFRTYFFSEEYTVWR